MFMPSYKYFDPNRPDPRAGFVGYKCPYYICDILAESHDSCWATRARLTAMGGPPDITDKEFESVFMFNFMQFTHKRPGVRQEILESFGSAPDEEMGL